MDKSSFVLCKLLFLVFIISSCEDGFEYENLNYDLDNKIIRLDEKSNFVIDSIILEYNSKVFYKSYRINGNGVIAYDLTKKYNGYTVLVDETAFMCHDSLKTELQRTGIWIRNLNVKSKDVDFRKFQQEFDYGSFPCESKKVVIEALKRI